MAAPSDESPPLEAASRPRAGLTHTGPTIRVQYAKARLVVTDGPNVGTQVEISHVPLRIGSDPSNGLVLGDDRVSRHHCEIVTTPTGVRVRDQGSTNGTFVGSIRLAEATFRDSFELHLGRTVLSVTPLDEKVERDQSTSARFGDLLGRTAIMRDLFADLMRVARTDMTVLIEGETGTGKELVAESIHRASTRANEPYVVFDCSAVAPTLAESELFGHERGAFTGAVAARAGVFEQAHGGTLFLDELGELPAELQPKLLRVLEKREVRRLGSSRATLVDVRLIAATNRNLRAEVESGNFRQDVYYRIAATRVTVPPLRDRLDDLPLLVAHFLKNAKPPRSVKEVPANVWDILSAYRWPGNVRELQNAVQRMLISPERALQDMASSSLEESPPQAEEPLEPWRIARRQAADDFERNYLKRVLGRTGRNVTRAAAIAELSRQMVQKLMRRHDL